MSSLQIIPKEFIRAASVQSAGVTLDAASYRRKIEALRELALSQLLELDKEKIQWHVNRIIFIQNRLDWFRAFLNSHRECYLENSSYPEDFLAELQHHISIDELPHDLPADELVLFFDNLKNLLDVREFTINYLLHAIRTITGIEGRLYTSTTFEYAVGSKAKYYRGGGQNTALHTVSRMVEPDKIQPMNVKSKRYRRR
ncbi:hypothetical protein [Nibrella viscosa]|uniref:hypothetical protein n=1 Tax=Nibrella viscosa TaxID=1084524 RepID=UPI0031E9F697